MRWLVNVSLMVKCLSVSLGLDPTEKSLLYIQTAWGEFLCMF